MLKSLKDLSNYGNSWKDRGGTNTKGVIIYVQENYNGDKILHEGDTDEKKLGEREEKNKQTHLAKDIQKT